MLPAWATVALTLGTAGITGLVAIVVPFIQERLRAKRAANETRELRRRNALELAVTVRSLAEDANLERYIVNTSREHYEYLQDLSQRLADARVPLIALAADGTDPALLTDVRDTLASVRRSIHVTALCVGQMVTGQPPGETFVEATRKWNPEAIEKADALIERFRPLPPVCRAQSVPKRRETG